MLNDREAGGGWEGGTLIEGVGKAEQRPTYAKMDTAHLRHLGDEGA